jgi:hypothetical protein
VASTSALIRTILTPNLDLATDEVIKKLRAKGVTAPEANVRKLVHNWRSEMRKAAGKPAPVAARQTAAPRPASVAPAPEVAAPENLTPVFANVVLVNKVVGVAGGVAQARQVAEAVRACGSVESFLQHLDLVAGIRAAE